MTDQLGLDLKVQGMTQALKAYDVQDWRAAFRSVIGSMPDGTMFTSEDVLEIIGLPRGEAITNANNAVGAMMNALAKQGLIAKAAIRRKAERPSSHGRELAVWIRSHHHAA